MKQWFIYLTGWCAARAVVAVYPCWQPMNHHAPLGHWCAAAVLGVPDEFQHRHSMLCLHIWLLLVRLRPEGKDGKQLAQVQAADCSARLGAVKSAATAGSWLAGWWHGLPGVACCHPGCDGMLLLSHLPTNHWPLKPVAAGTPPALLAPCVSAGAVRRLPERCRGPRAQGGCRGESSLARSSCTRQAEVRLPGSAAEGCMAGPGGYGGGSLLSLVRWRPAAAQSWPWRCWPRLLKISPTLHPTPPALPLPGTRRLAPAGAPPEAADGAGEAVLRQRRGLRQGDEGGGGAVDRPPPQCLHAGAGEAGGGGAPGALHQAVSGCVVAMVALRRGRRWGGGQDRSPGGKQEAGSSLPPSSSSGGHVQRAVMVCWAQWAGRRWLLIAPQPRAVQAPTGVRGRWGPVTPVPLRGAGSWHASR